LSANYICSKSNLNKNFFLGSFAKLRNAIIRLVMSICPSVLLSGRQQENFGSHWSDFHEILYLRIIKKSAGEILASLKWDKNNAYLTWRRVYVYISLNSSSNEKCCKKVVEKIKTHVICSTIFFSENLAFYEIMLEKYGTVTQATDDNIIRGTHIACRIRKTTDYFLRTIKPHCSSEQWTYYKYSKSITIYSIVLVLTSNRIAINPVKT